MSNQKVSSEYLDVGTKQKAYRVLIDDMPLVVTVRLTQREDNFVDFLSSTNLSEAKLTYGRVVAGSRLGQNLVKIKGDSSLSVGIRNYVRGKDLKSTEGGLDVFALSEQGVIDEFLLRESQVGSQTDTKSDINLKNLIYQSPNIDSTDRYWSYKYDGMARVIKKLLSPDFLMQVSENNKEKFAIKILGLTPNKVVLGLI